MRCFMSLICVLALVASPLSGSAQSGDEPTVEAPRDSHSVSGDTSAETGIDYTTPTATRLWAAERAAKRHRQGLIVSSVFFGVGVGALVGSIAWAPHADCGDDDPATLDICIPAGPIVVGFFGAAMVAGGFIGMAVKGTRLGKSRSELRELKEAQYGASRRVQWDQARSRLVF